MFALYDLLKVSSLSSEEQKKLSCVVTLTISESIVIQIKNLELRIPPEARNTAIHFDKTHIR